MFERRPFVLDQSELDNDVTENSDQRSSSSGEEVVDDEEAGGEA